MKQLWKWYIEKCRLSYILLAGLALWTASAWFLLKDTAPLMYVGLHFATTGVFFFLVLRTQQQSEAKLPPDGK